MMGKALARLQKNVRWILFEWRSALGMRRVALASAESNAAPSVAKPAAARPPGNAQKIIILMFAMFFAQQIGS